MPLHCLAKLGAAFVVAAAVSSWPTADATCSYNWTDSSNNLWSWDLGSLTTVDGWTSTRQITFNGTTYDAGFNLNFCQDAPFQCTPEGYVPDSQTGVVVEYWGTTPTCTKDSSGISFCMQGSVKKVGICCTQPCTVLSSSFVPEVVKPYDESQVGTASTTEGVILQFPTLFDSNTGRTICETGGPATMAAQYSIMCAPTVEFEVKEVVASGCEYNFVIDSKYGCATSGTITTTKATTIAPVNSNSLQGGDIFLIILFVVGVLYFGGGALILYFTTGACGIPNRAMWAGLGSLIVDGFNFLKSGCQKKAASYPGSSLDDGDYHEASNGTKATTSASYTNDDLYDDL